MLKSFKNYFGIGEIGIFEEFKVLNKSSKVFLITVITIILLVVISTFTTVKSSAMSIEDNSLEKEIYKEERKNSIILQMKYNVSKYKNTHIVKLYQYKGNNNYNRINMYNHTRDFSTYYKKEEFSNDILLEELENNEFYVLLINKTNLQVDKVINVNLNITLKQKVQLCLELIKLRKVNSTN